MTASTLATLRPNFVFECDYRKGLIFDRISALGPSSILGVSTWVNTPKGKALRLLRNGTKNGLLYNAVPTNITSGTYIFMFRRNALTTGIEEFIYQTAGFSCYMSGNYIGIYDYTSGGFKTSGVGIVDRNLHVFVCRFRSGVGVGTATYLDGVRGLDVTWTSGAVAAGLSVGNGPDAPLSGGCDASYLAISTAIDISDEDISRLSAELLNGGYVSTLSKRNFAQPEPAEVEVIATRDVLVDGDMEAVGTTAWPIYIPGTISKETTTPHGGSKCLRVAYNGVANPAVYQGGLAAGRRVRVTGWYRGDGAGTSVPKVFAAGVFQDTGTNSNTWQYFDITYMGTDGQLRLYAWGGSGYSEFDDIQVLESVGRYDSQLLNDGSMEMAGVTKWTAVAATLSKQTTNPQSGSQCLRITANAAGGTQYPSAVQTVTTVGKRYRLTGWVKSNGVRTPYIWIGASSVWVGTTSTSWQYFDIAYTATHTTITFLFSIVGPTGTEYVEFDDILLVEDCLVGHWDMSGRDGLWRDLSTGGNNLTKVGQVGIVRGLFEKATQFDGSTGYLTKAVANFRSVDDRGSITAWVRLSSLAGTNHTIFSSADNASAAYYLWFYLTNGKLAISQRNADTADVVTSTNTLRISEWYHVALTSSGTAWKLYINGASETLIVTAGANTGDWFSDATLRDNISIGVWQSNAPNWFFNGLINPVKLYSKTLSDAEVLTDYQRGARLLRYRNTFLDAPVTLAASSRELSDFQISTGTWKISEDSSSQKWLECVTAGVAYIPSTQAFGTFQWDVWKGSDVAAPFVLMISSKIGTYIEASQYAYMLHFSAVERFHFGETTNGVYSDKFYSVLDYGVTSTRYRIRVTRTHSGIFTTYVRGGVFTSWTQVSAFFGTNPFTDLTTTTSKFFCIDFDAGDKISNICMVEGVLDPTTFPEII